MHLYVYRIAYTVYCIDTFGVTTNILRLSFGHRSTSFFQNYVNNHRLVIKRQFLER